MRCRALAATARSLGINTTIGGRCTITWLRPLLAQEGFCLFEDTIPKHESPTVLLNHLQQMGCCQNEPCAVVLDGYHFTPECQSAVRKAGFTLMVIDDYAHLPFYDCDLLLNQIPGVDRTSYPQLTGKALFGSRYALLRPEFLTPPHRNMDSKTILITLGGGDFFPFFEQIFSQLSPDLIQGHHLQILSGSMPQEKMRQLLKDYPKKTFLPRVDDMPSLLADTELCITAGGSTCWELCRMGVPFLTVEVAENQHHICAWLDEQGYAPLFTPTNLTTLLENKKLQSERSALVSQLVDGKGAERAIQILKEFCL